MKQAIAKFILWITGWKITGEYPHHLKKFVLCAVPHTSNWDLALGILARNALDTDIKFVAKHTLFVPPFGTLFKWLGGFPVDRRKKGNFVDTMIDVFNSHDEFRFNVAAEGTRDKTEGFKSGFYYIALGANVPIVCSKLNYAKKELHFGNVFYPTGDKEKEIKELEDYFKGVHGKYPEKSFTGDYPQQ